jgi:chromosomal replication initiation ATPase DnaA
MIVSPANAEAVAFVDSWPAWPIAAAALYGPQGCGKTHLVTIWRAMSDAEVISAGDMSENISRRPLAIEDVDSAPPTLARDRILFAALEAAGAASPLLLTGREPPASWAHELPDLASRFAARAAFPLREPGEDVLAALAHKLFADRQLPVPDSVITRMLHLLERSPRAIRDFVARADAAALAQSRPVNLSLLRDLIAQKESEAG